MPKAAAHAPPTPSRLAHTLNALGVAASAAPRAGFADKLAELIDLSGAIALSESLRGLRRVKATGEVAGDDAQALFMARRADMIEAISASFTLDPEAMANSPAGFILPSPNADTFGSDAAGYAPYQRFYALHQSEIDHRVISLRGELRKLLAGRSEALAQLAEHSVYSPRRRPAAPAGRPRPCPAVRLSNANGTKPAKAASDCTDQRALGGRASPDHQRRSPRIDL